MPVYRVVVKNDDTAKATIENWKEVHKFDDFDFTGQTWRKLELDWNKLTLLATAY